METLDYSVPGNGNGLVQIGIKRKQE